MSAVSKVLTPKFRVSFPQVFKAEAFEDGDPKYAITMLFDKDADLTEMKKAAEAAAKEKWADKIPKNLRSPFRDGDEKELDGYAGKIFVRASSKSKPGVVDQNVKPIVDPSEFYPGCYARATVVAFAYEAKGNKGVSFALLNVQKLGDGEAFGNRSNPEDDFAPVAGEASDDIFG